MSMRRMVKAAAVFAAFAAISAAQVKNVAVVETELDAASGASAGISAAEARQVTTEIRREAVKNLPPDRYNIMTSETVQAQGSAVLEKCSEENCVIALGSEIGADYIVRGIISKLRDWFTLSVEVYETGDGNLVASSTPVRSDNVEELIEKAAAACADMYSGFVSSQSSRQVQRTRYTLEVSANPAEGGEVLRNPDREEYASGAKVNVMAMPATGYTFTGWSGASADTAANPVTVTMDASKALVANFSVIRKAEAAQAVVSQEERVKQAAVGVGGFFANNFNGGFVWENRWEALSMPYSGAGGYLYLDFTYLELFAGVSSGGGKWESADAFDPNDLPDMERSGYNYGIFLKWPAEAWIIRIFPMFGLEIATTNIVTKIKEKEPIKSYATEWWFKFGGGIDYDLTKYLMIRGEILYGWGLNQYGADIKKKVGFTSYAGVKSDEGLTFKGSVGFRF